MKKATEFKCVKCGAEFDGARRLGYHMYAKHGVKGKSKSSQLTWKKKAKEGAGIPGVIKKPPKKYKTDLQLREMIMAVNIRRDAMNDAYADVQRLLEGMKGSK